MTEQVYIYFWGVRGSTPCPNTGQMGFGGNTSCVQINLPETDELLIVDCGTGFRNLGNHLDQKQDPLVGNIFVTHPHWDHLQGFPFFKPFYRSDNTFQVHLPPQNGADCRDILHGHMSNTFFPVTMDMLEANLDCSSIDPGQRDMKHYSCDYMWARHTIKTAMFRFKIGDKVVIFAPDNELPGGEDEANIEFINEFKEFVRDADILIHDGQYSADQYADRVGWGHSARERVLDVCKDLNIRKLFLTHHDPDSDDDYLNSINKEIQSVYSTHFEEVSLAREGAKVRI